MRAVLLLTLLVTPSAFASSFFMPGAQPSKLTLAAEPQPGFEPAPFPPATSTLNVTAITVRLIDLQVQRLEFETLSLAGPVTFLVVGGAEIVVGLVMVSLGASISLLGLVVLAGSALPLAIGLVWLVSNLGFNARLNAAVEKLREERRALGVVTQFTASEPELVQLASF